MRGHVGITPWVNVGTLKLISRPTGQPESFMYDKSALGESGRLFCFKDAAVPAFICVAIYARITVADVLIDPPIPAFHLRPFCVLCGQISVLPLRPINKWAVELAGNRSATIWQSGPKLGAAAPRRRSILDRI